MYTPSEDSCLIIPSADGWLSRRLEKDSILLPLRNEELRRNDVAQNGILATFEVDCQPPLGLISIDTDLASPESATSAASRIRDGAHGTEPPDDKCSGSRPYPYIAGASR